MKTKLLYWLAAAALLAPSLAVAQGVAKIEGVQMPAWVERGEGQSIARLPAAPGMELQAGDRLKTAAGSRLLIRLGEGSLVKLGENARLDLSMLEPGKELFKGTLSVLEGAFRFTTQKLAKFRRRDININVSQVTAGVRGTDLWGRSAADRQIVCLIDGAIEVAAPNEAPVAMDKPLQFYQRDQGKAAPLAFVSPEQLKKWAAETEIERGKGAARLGSRFEAVIARAASQADALKVYDELRAAGYAAEIAPRREGEALSYVVRIRQLASRADARALAKALKGKLSEH